MGIASTYGGGGNDCTAGNGCGTHIHAGTSCTNSTTQMGHYYDSTVLTGDPWQILGYSSTNFDGDAQFAGCAFVGYDLEGGKAIDGLVFIIHEEDGSRVSCGKIKNNKKNSKSSKSSKSSKKSKRIRRKI